MAEDYYKTLGVNREASQAEIDKAYAKLARKYHPDVNPDDKSAKTKFQAVQSAYDVLKDPKKRELYDRYGSAFEGVGGGGPRPGQPWGHGAGPEEFDFTQFFGERFGAEGEAGFGDLFNQFRRAKSPGQGRRGRAARPQAPSVEHEVQIPFTLAVLGGETHLELRRSTGKHETIVVKIPAGIDDGKKIRLRGQGESLDDQGSADLLILIRVAPHPAFTRRGDHLHVRVPVTLREAAEGGKVDVPTPRGTVSLRVPPGTSSGAKLRIKGHGVTRAGKPAGDLFAEIQIVLPPNLDAKCLELARQFDERQPFDPRRDLKW
ncbi:MAG TPA: J domain-containing protein [Pirellulales bacterium]|jgi:DnaJ-class molecular chaperone|nr:J domain-containing protein [Pirellulales bacterium]